MAEDYDWMFHEHSAFEEMLEECIEQAELELWRECLATFNNLIAKLKNHMAMEEEILYPAYERHSELPQNPVQALRAEHDHLVQFLWDINQIIKTRDSEHLEAAIKPVVVALHHHHDKEEEFFLPMAGHLLLPYRESIIDDLKSFDPSKTTRKWPF